MYLFCSDNRAGRKHFLKKGRQHFVCFNEQKGTITKLSLIDFQMLALDRIFCLFFFFYMNLV